MRAGNLRHFIIIQSSVKSKNDYGEVVQTYEDFKHMWSEAKPIKTSERFKSERLETEVNYQFRVRYTEGIAHDMRVVFGERTFEIDSVLNVGERNRELIILASEVL